MCTKLIKNTADSLKSLKGYFGLNLPNSRNPSLILVANSCSRYPTTGRFAIGMFTFIGGSFLGKTRLMYFHGCLELI